MNSSEVIERYILEDLMVGSREQLDYDESLLEGGILDSLNLLRLVAFVEDRFHVQLDDEEIVLENFETVNAIVDLIQSKQPKKRTV